MRYGVRAVSRPPPAIRRSYFQDFLRRGRAWALARGLPEACGQLLVGYLVALNVVKARGAPPEVILCLLGGLERVRQECLLIVKPDDLGDFIAGIQNEFRPSGAEICHCRPSRGREPW